MQRHAVKVLALCTLGLVIALLTARAAFTDSPPNPIPGDVRPSVLYRPPGLSTRKPVPLVILLHGSGSSPQSIVTWSRFDRLADQQGFVVASLSTGVNKTWLAAEWMNSEADVDYIRAEIALLQQSQNIDPKRVFAVGFSAGGSMAYRAACELSPQIAAIGVVSSSFAMTTTCHPARPVAVMGIFGTTDGVIPFNGTARVEAPSASIARWRAWDTCPATPTTTGSGGVVTTQTWHPCAAGTAVAYTVIQGGLHTWSGSAGLPPSSPNAQLDATTVIWNFLAAHPLQPLVRTVAASIRSITLRHTGAAKTRLSVALTLGEAVHGKETLLRLGHVVLTKKITVQKQGNLSLVTTLRSRLKAGRYTVKLTLADSAGTTRTFTRSVLCPAP
jgi:polyhydroxybutyrate depolymerase